jgi:mono/diheme cytochrome c family protein
VITVSIQNGKGSQMPAFGDRLSKDEVQLLAAYVRGLGPAPKAFTRDSTTDFDERFRELQTEWRDLRRQFQRLSK